MAESQGNTRRGRGCGFGCALILILFVGLGVLVALALMGGLGALSTRTGSPLDSLFKSHGSAYDVGEDDAPDMIERWSSG